VETLVDYFRELSARRGTFLVFDDGYRRRTHSYADVVRAARGFAARLSDSGVRKDDKVVFWGENRPEWIVCFWGCLLVGVVVVPIDYRSSVEFVARVRALVGARALLIGEDVPPISAHVDLDGTQLWRFAELDWRADGPWPDVSVSRDDVFQIIFTSGATAEPKGVLIRHRNVMANILPVDREVKKYRKYARPFHPIRFLNLLPLSHMFGQSMATNVPPMIDGTVVFTRSFNPHDIMHLVHARRISVLVCVPKILDVLRDHALRAWPETADPAPPSISIPGRWWRYRRVHRALGLKFWAFVVGAAPLRPDIEEFWRKLGFAVIQGYGLTETAPIVTLNHPFRTSKGSVGTPIAGVDVRIADDGEILVRGENVTSGYYRGGTQVPSTDSAIDPDGWLHTGDVGERDAQGRLFIKGRKKDMIVTPEGLNVFPEDVERVLNAIPGVRDSAVVGVSHGAEERVQAALIVEPGADLQGIMRQANSRLQDHQRLRAVVVWPATELPRTDGTRKLKRREVREWLTSGQRPTTAQPSDAVEALLARFAQGHAIGGSTTLEELGLTSLERVELMVALEDHFQTRIDEARFSEATRVADLKRLVEMPARADDGVEEPVDFPTWSRTWPVQIIRRLSQAIWILPLARAFAHLKVDGREHLRDLRGPIVLAANHQSHMDVPVILAALPGHLRARIAPAMAKEFFKAHFFPAQHSWRERLTNSLNYYLAAFYFNAFPLPQREAGARQTLQYIGELTGDNWSVLIFPEGLRSEEIKPFRGGIGMIGARLEIPVVPVRIRGVNQVLHPAWMMVRPGPVQVAFGAALHLRGDDYGALASQVEAAVRAL
jgi:long-chain acyl-CoA synthetase